MFFAGFSSAAIPSYTDISRSSGEYPNQNWLFNNITITFGGVNPWLFYALNSTDVGGMSNPEGTSGYLNSVVMLDPSLLLHFSFENQSVYGENDTRVAGFRGDGEAWLYNGTVVGGNVTTPFGKYGRGMNFDGVNDFINITGSPSLQTRNITLMAWVYPTSYNNYAQIITKSNGTDAGTQFELRFYSTTGKINFVVSNNTGYAGAGIVSNSIIPLNTWTFLAGTWNGTNLRLYINGAEDATMLTFTGNGIIGNEPITISFRKDQGLYWNGSIDEVKIWNRPLSDKEIKYQYLSDLRKLYNGTAHWELAINETGLLKGNYTRAYDMNSSGGSLNHNNNFQKYSQIWPTDFMCFDEQNTGVRLNFNTTVAGTTSYNNQNYLILTTPVSNSLISYLITGNDGTYLSRTFQLNGNQSSNNTCYLLKTSASTVVRIRVLTYGEMNIPNALVNVSRSFSGIPQIIDMQYTDVTGTTTFYLDSTSVYTFTVSAGGYTTVSMQFQPSSSDYRVQLSAGNTTNIPTVFENVSVAFSPTDNVLNVSTTNQTLSVTITDNEALLNWYALELWSGSSLLGSQNTTGAAGGTLSFSVNTSLYSTIVLKAFFQKSTFDAQLVSKTYGIGEIYSGDFSLLAQAANISHIIDFGGGAFISLLVLMITLLVSGYIAGTVSFVGGGAIAVAMLAFFNLLGVFRLTGQTGLDWGIFLITGLLVASVLYLRGRV